MSEIPYRLDVQLPPDLAELVHAESERWDVNEASVVRFALLMLKHYRNQAKNGAQGVMFYESELEDPDQLHLLATTLVAGASCKIKAPKGSVPKHRLSHEHPNAQDDSGGRPTLHLVPDPPERF